MVDDPMPHPTTAQRARARRVSVGRIRAPLSVVAGAIRRFADRIRPGRGRIEVRPGGRETLQADDQTRDLALRRELESQARELGIKGSRHMSITELTREIARRF